MEQVQDLKKLVKRNDNYRKAITTGKYSQIVVMSLKPGEEIAEETHPSVDQIFMVEDGEGQILIDNKMNRLDEHSVAFVPAGAKHFVRNTGSKALKLCTIYSPPLHAPNMIEISAPKATVKM